MDDESVKEPAQIVVAPQPSAPVKSTWQWTKVKRKAVQLVLEGYSDRDIGDKLGKHRNTILAWRHTPEFALEVKEQMEQFATRLKLKRIRQTTALTDVFVSKLATAANEDNLAKVGTYGREFHAMRMEERQDLGDNIKRVDARVQVDGKHEHTVTGVGFREFLEKNADVIDAEVVAAAGSEADAVVLAAQQVLQHSDYLEQLHEQDKQALKDNG